MVQDHMIESQAVWNLLECPEHLHTQVATDVHVIIYVLEARPKRCHCR